MWWILQTLYIIGVVFIQVFNRSIGLPNCPYTFSFKNTCLINAGWLSLIAPMAIISYAKAPSFFQPWFLGTALIALFGFATSFFIFGEPILMKRMIGASLSLIGIALLMI
jgi:hypothetical protein